jgi:endo-1,4-beta-xylanase
MSRNRHAVRAAVIFLACALPLSAVAADVPAPAAPTLRELMATRGLMIGAAVDVQSLKDEPEYGRVLAEQFNELTPENAMKFDGLHPRPGFGPESYDFGDADDLVAFAAAHDMKVRAHTLVWYRAVPKWAKGAAPEHLREILQNHVETVAAHFKGKVYSWDVVNEALNRDGSMRDCPWLTADPDYVADAFRWAHAADPGAKLFYNDYDMERSPAKADAVIKLIKGLKDAGVPIDGVGLQMHVVAGPHAGDVADLLHRFAALGVEVHITELDVSPVDVVTAVNSAIGSTPPASDLRLQGEVYARALRSCLSEPACKAFVMWGFTDKHTWLPVFQPLIFDKQYQPKPAFAALENVLLSH